MGTCCGREELPPPARPPLTPPGPLEHLPAYSPRVLIYPDLSANMAKDSASDFFGLPVDPDRYFLPQAYAAKDQHAIPRTPLLPRPDDVQGVPIFKPVLKGDIRRKPVRPPPPPKVARVSKFTEAL